MSECRKLLCHGSRSFYLASRFLPLTLRESASGLYAFCRIADDLVDLGDHPHQALETLHHRLDLIYAATPENHPVDRVLSQIVTDHELPRALLNALLEGFEWDATGRCYETLEDVFDYGARVAGTVGVMMAMLMGVRDTHSLARAADLGVAMQLTNICRDVGEDARAGRLYLPRGLLREQGIDPEDFIQNPQTGPALTAVLNRLLREADDRYQKADQGIRQLPRRCRPGIWAARRLYAEIGHKVAQEGYDPISRRAVVSGGRKCQILISLMQGARANPAVLSAPCAPENQFLINAVPRGHEWQNAESPRRFSPSASWMLELFIVMGQRDEMAIHGQSREQD
jgi:phytoene synthase